MGIAKAAGNRPLSKTKKDYIAWQRSPSCKKDVDVWLELFRDKALLISTEGKMYDPISKRQFMNNHLKCLLRGEYEDRGSGKLRGKSLSYAIDNFLEILRKTRDTGIFKHMDIVEDEVTSQISDEYFR